MYSTDEIKNAPVDVTLAVASAVSNRALVAEVVEAVMLDVAQGCADFRKENPGREWHDWDKFGGSHAFEIGELLAAGLTELVDKTYIALSLDPDTGRYVARPFIRSAIDWSELTADGETVMRWLMREDKR